MLVVLLHTAFANARQWQPQREALVAAGHEVRVPEMTCGSTDAWAQEVLEQVDGSFVAMGASMGAYTVGAVAKLAPERILGMLVTSITTFHAFPEAVRHAHFDDVIALHRSGDPDSRWAGIAANVYSEAAPPSEYAKRLVYEMMLEVGQEQGVAHMVAVRDHSDTSDAVRALVTSGVPLLVIGSDPDPMSSPADYHALVTEVGGRCEVITNGGHVPPVDQPHELARIATEFVAEIQQRIGL